MKRARYGCIAALNVLAIMQKTGMKISELQQVVTNIPQKQINVKVSKKISLDQIKGFPELLQRIAIQLNGEGRTLVRLYGPELLVRILEEGDDTLEIEQYAEEIATLLRKELG